MKAHHFTYVESTLDEIAPKAVLTPESKSPTQCCNNFSRFLCVFLVCEYMASCCLALLRLCDVKLTGWLGGLCVIAISQDLQNA